MAKENKTILALYGAADTGKTTTLKTLIELYKDLQKDMKEVTVEELLVFRWGDRGAIVHYKGKAIGIFTGGDSRGDLADAMKKLDDKCDCDIDLYVCASRTSGQTVDYLRKLAKTVYWVRRMDTSADPENSEPIKDLRELSYKQQANDLVKMIDTILFGLTA